MPDGFGLSDLPWTFDDQRFTVTGFFPILKKAVNFPLQIHIVLQ